MRKETLAQLDHKEMQEHWAILELLGLKVRAELLVILEQLVLLEQEVQWAIQERLGLKVRVEQQVTQEPLDLKGHKVQLELQEQGVQLVIPELRDPLVEEVILHRQTTQLYKRMFKEQDNLLKY